MRVKRNYTLSAFEDKFRTNVSIGQYFDLIRNYKTVIKERLRILGLIRIHQKQYYHIDNGKFDFIDVSR